MHTSSNDEEINPIHAVDCRGEMNRERRGMKIAEDDLSVVFYLGDWKKKRIYEKGVFECVKRLGVAI